MSDKKGAGASPLAARGLEAVESPNIRKTEMVQ
jgi:hypothetical protein